MYLKVITEIITNKMSFKEKEYNDHIRSLVSFSDTENNCDYVIGENFDVKDYLSDVLNVDYCDTYLTGIGYKI